MNLYLDTLKNKNNTTQIPVWMMRQAGRYLPEYRKIKQSHTFLDMVYSPEVAAEVTLQPIKRFDFDAAILFSDILVIPQVFNMKLDFLDKIGPKFQDPITPDTNLNTLPKLEEKLNPIYETVKLCRKELHESKALIGFAGAPFTVASYMCEGGSSKDLKTTKQIMYSNPTFFHALLEKITEATIEYLYEQVKAGVDALQLFDTWISHLDWECCETFSARYITKIVTELRQRNINVPITFFGKHTSLFYPLYEQTGVNVISFDWGANLSRVDASLNSNLAIQGNLDPYTLYSSENLIKSKVKQICNSVKNRPFIFNLGHGLMPDIPIKSVQMVLDEIRSR